MGQPWLKAHEYEKLLSTPEGYLWVSFLLTQDVRPTSTRHGPHRGAHILCEYGGHPKISSDV